QCQFNKELFILAIYIFCTILVLVAVGALLTNRIRDKKDKRLDILSSVLLLISSISLLLYGVIIN
ncbi:hypothetical protein, partial [Staphylococcus aureus]|uniref:hypothetical protein n=2 Tax=Staphylococcus aureus TaxID=1280 RepID=UPI001C9CFEE8